MAVRTFGTKVSGVLGSPRFWMVVIASVAFGLMEAGLIDASVAKALIAAFGGAAGVGTIDRLGTK